MFTSNVFLHCLPKLASSPSSNHSIFSSCTGRIVYKTWSTSYNKRPKHYLKHGLCTTTSTARLHMLATARQQVTWYTSAFRNLMPLSSFDAILSFETLLLQNWIWQYTSKQQVKIHPYPMLTAMMY